MKTCKLVRFSKSCIAILLSFLLSIMWFQCGIFKAYADDDLDNTVQSSVTASSVEKLVSDLYDIDGFEFNISNSFDQSSKDTIDNYKQEFENKFNQELNFITSESNKSSLQSNNDAEDYIKFAFNDVIKSGADSLREGFRWWNSGTKFNFSAVSEVCQDLGSVMNVGNLVLNLFTHLGIIQSEDNTQKYLESIYQIRIMLQDYHDNEMARLDALATSIDIDTFMQSFRSLYDGAVSLTTALQLCANDIASYTKIYDTNNNEFTIQNIYWDDDFSNLTTDSKLKVLGYYSALCATSTQLGCNDINSIVAGGISLLNQENLNKFMSYAQNCSGYTDESQNSIYEIMNFIFNITTESWAQAVNLQLSFYRYYSFLAIECQDQIDTYKSEDYYKVEIETTQAAIDQITKDIEERENEYSNDESNGLQDELFRLKMLRDSYQSHLDSVNEEFDTVVDLLQSKSANINIAKHWGEFIHEFGYLDDHVEGIMDVDESKITLQERLLGFWQDFSVAYNELNLVVVNFEDNDGTYHSVAYSNLADAWIDVCLMFDNSNNSNEDLVKQNHITISVSTDVNISGNIKIDSMSANHKGEMGKYFKNGGLYYNNDDEEKHIDWLSLYLNGHSFIYNKDNVPIIETGRAVYFENLDGLNKDDNTWGTISGLRVQTTSEYQHYIQDPDIYFNVKNVNFVRNGFHYRPDGCHRWNSDKDIVTIENCTFKDICDSAIESTAVTTVNGCIFDNCQATTGNKLGGAAYLRAYWWRDWNGEGTGDHELHCIPNEKMSSEVNNLFDNEFLHFAFLNCEFENCSANEGGAIYAESGAFGVYGCSFDNNKANNGGAVYCKGIYDDNETITIDDGPTQNGKDDRSFCRNYFVDVKINNNTASKTGGGVYGNKLAYLWMQDVDITNNTAATAGGVYCGAYADVAGAGFGPRPIGEHFWEQCDIWFAGNVQIHDNYDSQKGKGYENLLLHHDKGDGGWFGAQTCHAYPEIRIWNKGGLKTPYLSDSSRIFCMIDEHPDDKVYLNGKDVWLSSDEYSGYSNCFDGTSNERDISVSCWTKDSSKHRVRAVKK